MITPAFAGQIYRDTATGNIWQANSTTPGDWTLLVQDMQLTWLPRTTKLGEVLEFKTESNTTDAITSIISTAVHSTNGFNFYSFTNLQSLSLPNLIDIDPVRKNAIFSITYCGSILSISAPNLVTIGNNFNIDSNTLLNSINVPLLATLTYDFIVSNNPELTALSFPSLTTISEGNFNINTNVKLASLSAPSLETVFYDVSIYGCPLLTTIDLSSWLPTNGSFISLYNNALTLATVDNLLARGVANAAFVSGSIDISGGTNAAPTQGAGSAHDILVARGVTITHN